MVGMPVSLTVRECGVISLVAKGRSSKDVAAALFIGERTVRTHVSHLLAELASESRIQLAIWAHGNGFPLASPRDLVQVVPRDARQAAVGTARAATGG